MDTAIFKQKAKQQVDWLAKEYTGIRTGQAAPALLDGVKVEQYGTFMPLNQIGSIGIEDARTLRISPWDAGSVGAIERAMADSNLGVSVATDSAGLRVIFPELTSERRTQLLKLAKNKLEDARIALRGVRDEAMKEVDKQHKAGDLTDDDKFTDKETIQKIVDETNAELEVLFDKKQTEIEK